MTSAIPDHRAPLPHLSTEQMRAVDRAMVADYGITLVQMMENAGRALAHLARLRFLEGDPRGRSVMVLAGTGGNGGGALVAARRLAGYGAQVAVRLTRDDAAYAGVPARQLAIVRRLGLPVTDAETAAARSERGTSPVELVIDGIIGYSLAGAPRGGAAQLIDWANQQRAPVLALDVPSGLDATTGAGGPAVRATATMTLALPKTGLRAPAARPLVGELYLADIGVPPALYAAAPLALEVGPLFASSDLLRLEDQP